MRTLLFLAPLALLPGAMAARVEAASGQEPATPEKKLAALIERFNKEQSATEDAYSKAKTDDEKDAIWAKRPGKEYIPEFRALAEEAKGTETAVRAWLWVLKLIPNDPKESMRIVDLLLAEHMDSEALGELTGGLRDSEALRALVAESPHERVRAAALFKLGKVLLEKPSAEEKAEGRDCMQAIITEYGEISQGERTYANQAEGYLFELDHLQIGMTAPDFESVDENGVKWKLSDYRGKVVVVDFWGFW